MSWFDKLTNRGSTSGCRAYRSMVTEHVEVLTNKFKISISATASKRSELKNDVELTLYYCFKTFPIR